MFIFIVLKSYTDFIIIIPIFQDYFIISCDLIWVNMFILLIYLSNYYQIKYHYLIYETSMILIIKLNSLMGIIYFYFSCQHSIDF
jgi:hypothetical protein